MLVQKEIGIQPFQLHVFSRQVRLLAWANMKSRYRKTVMGFIWVVLNPLIMFGVQSLVFGRFLHIQIPQYSLFLVSGLLPWIFISQSIDMCTSIFVTSSRLLKSLPVHPLVYLSAQIFDNLINFLAAFTLILLPLWCANPRQTWGILCLPLAVVFLTAGVIGLSWLLATFQVFLRDTRFLVAFVMSVAFYLTPVFYSPEFIPASVRWITRINPLYYLIDPFRIAIYSFDPTLFFTALAKAAGVALILMATAAFTWKRKKNAIYFNL